MRLSSLFFIAAIATSAPIQAEPHLNSTAIEMKSTPSMSSGAVSVVMGWDGWIPVILFTAILLADGLWNDGPHAYR